MSASDNGDPAAFVGDVLQVAVVTADLYSTIDGLMAVGVGPFSVFRDVKPAQGTYMGEPAEFSMTMAIANVGTMMWEVIVPGSGPSIYQDFLDEGGAGLHHIAIGVGGIPYADRVAGLLERGYQQIQSGVAFDGAVPFGYFHDGNKNTPIMEIFEFPEGFEPVPDEIYPAPEPA